MTNFLKVFNNHLMEFIEDLETIFPDNIDIKTGHTFISSIKTLKFQFFIIPYKIIYIIMFFY